MIVLVFLTLWVIFKNTRLKRLSPLCGPLCLLARVISVNLLMRNKMPVVIDSSNISGLEHLIWLGFIYSTTFIFYDFKVTLFINAPIFIVGTYFQGLA